jgi:hypothetical protein
VKSSGNDLWRVEGENRKEGKDGGEKEATVEKTEGGKIHILADLLPI